MLRTLQELARSYLTISKALRVTFEDRTMVGNSATRLACEFHRNEWRRHVSERETTGPKSILDQAAAEQMWLLGGAECRREYFCRSGGEKCFSLDISFNRTPRQVISPPTGLTLRQIRAHMGFFPFQIVASGLLPRSRLAANLRMESRRNLNRRGVIRRASTWQFKCAVRTWPAVVAGLDVFAAQSNNLTKDGCNPALQDQSSA